MSVNINVKPQGMPGVSSFSITVPSDSTVGDLKNQVANKCGLDSVRMVASGKVLKDFAATLSASGLKEGSNIVVVKDAVKKPEEDEAAQKAKYAQQLSELHDMGFEDEKQCLAALIKHSGDIALALNMLAEDPNAGKEEAISASSPVASSGGQVVAAGAGNEVIANVYDISGGMAQMCSQSMIGKYMDLLPHTGIVVFGQEYFFSREPEVSEPGKSLPSPVKKTFPLGRTEKTKEELEAFLGEIKSQYTASTYDFLNKNSNHYADAVAKFLLEGTGLPAELLSLAETMNATPQGMQMAQMMSQMEAQTRAQGGQSFFSPTGTFFHGGTPTNPAMAQLFTGQNGMANFGAMTGAMNAQNAAQNMMMQGGYAGNPGTVPASPRTRFKKELEELTSMGFPDSDKCIRALLQANGDISAAVDILASL